MNFIKNTLKSENIASIAVVVFATILGAFPRLFFALISDFPLVDGGLFYQMIQDIEAAHFALPAFTTYNHADIPFAYPPFVFYASALLSTVTGWSELDIVRLLPPVMTVFTIPVFFSLSQLFLTRLGATLATFAFALLPPTFDWLVLGGGLARAPGYFFALLTIRQTYLAYNTNQRKYVWTATLFAAITVLSHPVMAWFAAYSAGLLFAFYGRDKKGLVKTGFIAAGTILLSAPWWLTVITRHGLPTLFGAFQSGFYSSLFSISSVLYAFLLLFTNEPVLDIFAVIGLIGIFWSLRNQRYGFLPSWLLTSFLLQTRFYRTFSIVPFAMIFAIGLAEVVIPAIERTIQPPSESNHQINHSSKDSTEFSLNRVSMLALGYIFIVGLFSVFLSSPKTSLSPAQAEAMQWIRDHTGNESIFVIIYGTHPSSDPEFGDGEELEWFPALTHRTSALTPQGFEWKSIDEGQRRHQLNNELQICAEQGIDCMQGWIENSGVQFSHIYLAKKGEDTSLSKALRGSSEFVVIYDEPEVLIFEHHPETISLTKP